jgi:5-methyltetrahydrofolate--homocysteine methyltransferase
MAHVAREMERQGFTIPLLIGGATTSRAHTAIKIAPAYSGPVVHVLDASRAVGVVSQLKSPSQHTAFVEQNRLEQDKLRQAHRAKATEKPLLSLEEARRRRLAVEWTAETIAKPSFLGTRVVDAVPLEEIVGLIDWSPFFHAWEMKGTYPRIFENPSWGARAKELWDEAQVHLRRIVEQKELTARAVRAFFPANSVGDDIEVYADDSRSRLLGTFHTLRQQSDKGAAEPNLALADFIAPRESGLVDYLGLFAVTTGLGMEALVADFERVHDDYGAIMAKALADRLAEALAELMHQRARQDWGYGGDEQLTIEELIRERYRGIRPAPGYPACPDHTEKRLLFELLGGESAVAIQLTESFAMSPAASISGFYFAHPQARYFAVGKIGQDQVLDYHRRKGMDLRTLERWLAPSLGYESEILV